ncbi:MAG: tetratricopeptide repeat protein [Cellvibrio sp.]
MMPRKYYLFLLISGFAALHGCTTQQPEETLRLLDIQGEKNAQNEVFVKPKSEEEIKEAYYNYIKSAPADDKSRLSAINRLAELEMNRINELVKNARGPEDAEDRIYRESLEKTLSLLLTSLQEYPDAKGNDKTLYQLARTYDQLGEHEQSIAALERLCRTYPASPYYAEAQFRIGENAFIQGDYIAAEDAYTETIFTSIGDVFYERALFKRGWARYKQALYLEAADDYLAALKHHRFGDVETLSSSEKDQFDEYFRAIGLTFANLDSTDILQEYFADEADFQYLYHTYKTISDIYLKQERYSDAAKTLQEFITANPKSPKVARAYLQQIEIWKAGKFRARFQDTMDVVYNRFNPASSYWESQGDANEQKLIAESLRHHILQVATWHQEEYQQTKRAAAFSQADLWYQRYLTHYAAYAQQDKVYTQYAELLAAENRHQDAIHYFSLAAYDGDIVLNKEAAYATIVLSDTLYKANKNRQWLDKHLQYALTSAQLYQSEARYQKVALYAAELAYNNERYADAIALTNTLPDSTPEKTLHDANLLKGLAYLKLAEHKEAENIFADLLEQPLDRNLKQRVSDNLALAIYQQAEGHIKENRLAEGIQDYARIATRVPASEIAPTALYEAVALSMKHEHWQSAINYIEQFQQLYPKHTLNKDATRQLSTAYLKAGDGVKAAQAFEKISAQEDNQDVKMAALWQAAELYESKNNHEAAIRSYRTYANTYTRPYPQYMEAMYKLTQLYQKTRDQDKVIFWQEKIALADKQASKNNKTERTNFIASRITLDLAQMKHQQFERRRLVEPLTENLRVKKKLMQDAIALYGQASVYSHPEITTEATYAIGQIYQQFASALLDSERPRHLKGEELEQYNILIEDQAFPFEEKAIEFYEINLARTRDGTRGNWIEESRKALVTLFPVRYDRKGKLGVYRHDI